jgi:cytochrome P450
VYSISLADDPHAEWREIRSRAPVLAAGGDVYFVSRWQSVDAILRDPRHGAGVGVAASFGDEGEARGLAFDVMRVWLMSLDGAEQTRARGLVRRAFSPRRIEALRPLITRTTDRLIGEIEAQARDEPVDLVAQLAFALPSEITRTLFGLEEAEWQDEVVRVIHEVDDSPGASLAMIDGLARFFERRLARDAIPDGLLAQLRVPDPELGALTPLEVVANAVLLVTAAIDTTAGLIGNLAHCVLDRPALRARLRAEPACARSLVEETLRFEPPALSCSRRAGVDLELDGQPIPAGSHLLLGLAAANRDPDRYPDPDRFDLDRDFQGLLSFGGGRHFCLGAALARLEAQVVAERLFVASGLDFERLESAVWQRGNPTVRALERLPVRGRPRSG